MSDLRTSTMRLLFRLGVPVPKIKPTSDDLISELEKRISTAIKYYADSERAAMYYPNSYFRRLDCTAYEAMKNLASDADDIAKYALSEWKADDE